MRLITLLATALVTIALGCGGERLKHPKTVIVEVEKCAKEHGLRFTASAQAILHEVSEVEKKIGEYDVACKGRDNEIIRRAFMCYLNACEKLPKGTSAELFFTKIENPCDKEIKTLSEIASAPCVEWIGKLQKSITGK